MIIQFSLMQGIAFVGVLLAALCFSWVGANVGERVHVSWTIFLAALAWLCCSAFVFLAMIGEL